MHDLASLALFTWLLLLSVRDAGERSYAASGGKYIVTSLIWLWLIEDEKPDHRDVTGAILAITATAIMLRQQRV